MNWAKFKIFTRGTAPLLLELWENQERSPRSVCLHQCCPHQSFACTREPGHTPARGSIARQPSPPPAWNCDQLDLTLRCRIRPTDCSQDGSEEMVQPLQPGTHGGRQSPPHSCLFPLANPVRARGQWEGTLPLAAASGLHSGEPAATPLGLGKPSGSTVTTFTFSGLGSFFFFFFFLASYNSSRRWDKGQDRRKERKASYKLSLHLWQKLPPVK